MGKENNLFTKTDLIQIILLLITINPLAACTSRIEPVTPTALLPSVNLLPTSTAIAPQVSPTSVVELPADWQVYSDSALGFLISHPPGWQICTTTEHSRSFCISQAGGVGFPVFYVTVTPPGFTNVDASAYNFVAEDIVQAFATLQVGGGLTTGDPNPDFSTYTRLPDVEVSGETGLVVENIRVWEAGSNTKDHRVFVQYGNDLYMIGTYYETPTELKTFQAILATFKFE